MPKRILQSNRYFELELEIMIYELEESHVRVYNVLVQLIISPLVKEYTYFPNPGLIISFERNWLQFYVLVNTIN